MVALASVSAVQLLAQQRQLRLEDNADTDHESGYTQRYPEHSQYACSSDSMSTVCTVYPRYPS